MFSYLCAAMWGSGLKHLAEARLHSGLMHRAMKFAKHWECLKEIRARFRKGDSWLYVPTTPDGEAMMQSTAAIKHNSFILIAMLEAGAGRKVKVGPLQKQVPWYIAV